MNNELVEIKQNLYKDLEPIYQDLINKLRLKGYKNDEISSFLIRIGNHYKKHESILFVGKATNGWGAIPDNLTELFDNFTSINHMDWNDEEYSLNKSAFWRLIKNITQKEDDWMNYIAWSNLCKIAPAQGGNPNDQLFNEQLKFSKKILKKEIEILQPKAVILLTSDWNILDFDKQSLERKEKWGDKYSTDLYKINDVYYLWSHHPQGKVEEPHVEAILKLLNEIKVQGTDNHQSC